MKAKITRKLLAKVEAKDKAYDIWDTKRANFHIRVYPSGRYAFRYQYKRTKAITIARSTEGKTLDEIHAELDKLMPELSNGTFTNAISKQKLTLKDFIAEYYAEWRLLNNKSAEIDLRRLQTHFLSPFGDRGIDDINVAEIEKWRSTRLKQNKSPATINRDVTILKSALNKAVEWGHIKINLIGDLKPLKEKKDPIIRYLSLMQLRALKQYAKSYADANPQHKFIHAIIVLSLNTGTRQNELRQLEWCEVNFERKTLTIPASKTKNNVTRHIPLNNESYEILNELSAVNPTQQFVFSTYTSNRMLLHRTWKRLLKEVGIKNFRWHDMRHHFASWLVMSGVDLNTVRELLGHSDIKQTLKYARACKLNCVTTQIC